MGLKDLADAGKKSTAKTGLRNLAEQARAGKAVVNKDKAFFFQAEDSFVDFLNSINIQKAGFLLKSEGKYSLSFPVGVDSTSFKKLIIPEPIMKTAVEPSNSWTKLGDAEFSLFRNFFASHEYIIITEILLFALKENEEFLMLIRSQNDKDKSPFDFDKANNKLKDFIPTYIKYKKIFHSAKNIQCMKKTEAENPSQKIEQALKQGYVANLFDLSFKAIFPDINEVEKDLKKLRLYSSIVKTTSSAVSEQNIAELRDTLLLCIFSKQKLKLGLYLSQIKKVLKPVFGAEISDRLIMENLVHSTNEEEIKIFLKIE